MTQAMPSELQSSQLVPLPMGTPWTGRGSVNIGPNDNAVLGYVDYGDADQVETARQAILGMESWSSMVPWAFQSGREDEGLAAIARIILCTKAYYWSRDIGEMPVSGLRPADALAAQVSLFSVLSPLGLQALTARPEVVGDGIRYTPDTGDAEADKLLRMVVTQELVSALRALPGSSGDAAELLETHARAWRQAEPLREAASRLEDEGWKARRTRNYGDAARTLERAAMMWRSADQSGLETARALGAASLNWSEIDAFARAASADVEAAKIWAAAGLFGNAARAYSIAARNLNRAGQHASTEQAHAHEARAWEVADHPAFAAAAWQLSGSPERAARNWMRALQDAGAGSQAAADISVRGAPMFAIALDEEGGCT